MTNYLLEGGTLYGCRDADSILLGDGRILAVGHRNDLLARPSAFTARCRRVSLDGRLVIPGFIDAHTHFLQTGLIASGRQISLVGLTRHDTLQALASAAERRTEGEWIVARGWDESSWNPSGYLLQHELDQIGPGHPVAAIRIDGHIMVLNSLGASRFPAQIEYLPNGEAPGVVREEAVFEFGRAMLAASPSHELDEAFGAAARLAYSLGITSVHAMAPREEVAVYRRVREQELIRVNVCPEPPAIDELANEGIKTGSGDEWLRYGGVKLFADGSIGAANAAVGEPFIGRTCGRLNHSDNDVREFIASCDQAGWQTVIHAIGDRAIEQVLAAHEAVGSTPRLRHRIEHYELPRSEHLVRTKRIGIWLCMQPNFIGQWSGPASLYVERLGETRDRRSNPLREILDAGISVGFGSDGMPMSPLYGVRSVVRAPYREQRLRFDEAVDAYTHGAAALSHEESIKGTLTTGACADLAVLSGMASEPEQIDDLRIDATFLGGELVFER